MGIFGELVEKQYANQFINISEKGTCANTKNIDHEMFFRRDVTSTLAALNMCHTCPVKEQCLEFTLAHERNKLTYRHGVSGGTTPAMRDAIANDRDPQAHNPSAKSVLLLFMWRRFTNAGFNNDEIHTITRTEFSDFAQANSRPLIRKAALTPIRRTVNAVGHLLEEPAEIVTDGVTVGIFFNNRVISDTPKKGLRTTKAGTRWTFLREATHQERFYALAFWAHKEAHKSRTYMSNGLVQNIQNHLAALEKGLQ